MFSFPRRLLFTPPSILKIVKNTQLSLSHSCMIARSVRRCQGNEMQNYWNCRYFSIDSL